MKKQLRSLRFCPVVMAILMLTTHQILGQTTLTNFDQGACIIDMSVVPQTKNNALRPYGLVYDLVTNHNIPVYWIINPNKSFQNAANKFDEIDLK